ncbi:hypothetical protein [Aeromonas veronii]|uniref:hypothetical protein n=1 Tax=Aeromonas veronii TaxID=654 RepID=UPI003BA00FF8
MYPVLNLKDGEIFITSLEIETVVGMQKHVSQSGKVNTRATGVHRFEFEFKVQCFGEKNIRYMQTFLNSNMGSPIVIPPVPHITASPSTNSIVQTAIQAGSSTIPVSGHRGAFAYGDYITFQNHTKLYNCTCDLKAQGNLTIYPPLRKAVQAQEQIIVNPQLTLQLTDAVKMSYDDVYWIGEFTFKATEV